MFEDEIPLGRAENLAGQRFGRLTALYRTRAANQGKYAMWHCRCDCGNEKNVRAHDLRSGHTRSCGCLDRETRVQNGRKRAVDLTNMRFSKLVALYPTEERSGTNVVWHCICDCGNTTSVSANDLCKGHTRSCGCLVSQGEQKISELLNQNKIEFTTQQSFEDCKYSQESNKLPRFDFFIKNSYLVEYDGIQHFSAQELFGGESQFQLQQKRDAYKNQWCKDHNIPLIRIPYTKLDTLCIEDLLLETTQFRVV